MGLDVYLYPIAEHEQNERHEQEWEALYRRKERGEITEAEYDDLRKTITQYVGRWDEVNKGAHKSERHPEHYFDRRYLRSSYNGGGFNRAVPDFLGADEGGLYWIFAPMGREWDGDEGILTADDILLLEECKGRALAVAERLRACDPLRVETPSAGMIGPASHFWQSLPREADVLAWYRDEKNRNAEHYKDKDSGGYSNAKGTVFGFDKGLEVLAITMGRDVLGSPCPVIVYRGDATFYIEGADVVAEFCDEAIELVKRDGRAYISWSG